MADKRFSELTAGTTVNDADILAISQSGTSKKIAASVLKTYSQTGVQPLDADLTAIAGLAGTSGILKKTAADTWALDTSTYLTSAVTSVSGTAPIVSSGGNTPAISISAATTSAAGSMSSADKTKLDGIASGATANTGTVTSVAVTVPTGLSVSGSPVTTSGTIAIALTSGYAIPTTASQTNWDTAYTDRNNWDGGATGLTAATGRVSLGLGTAATMTGPSGTIVGTTDSQTLTNKTITGVKETETAPSISAGTLTLDCSTGNIFAVSLNADITTLTFSNVPTSGTAYALTLSLTADGTARTITWGAAVKWPSGTSPTLTSTSGKVDTFVLTTWDAGTTWYAFTAGQNA
jgi:hypothetical protein